MGSQVESVKEVNPVSGLEPKPEASGKNFGF